MIKRALIVFLLFPLLIGASRQISHDLVESKAAGMNANNYIHQTCGMTWASLDTSSSSNGVDEVILDLYAPSPYGIPLCAIYEYQTDEDDDMAWSCDVEYTNEGYHFKLQKYYDGDNNGYVLARAVLLSYDYFNLSSGAYFWVYDDYVEYQLVDSDIKWKLNGDYARIPFTYIPAKAAPVTTINHYGTNKDDDFSFYSAMEWGGQGANLVLDASNGNDGSYIFGTTYIIEPRDNDRYKGFIDENGLFLYGNLDEYYAPFTYYRWPYLKEANIFMFTTLFAYQPNDNDFSAAASPAYNVDVYNIVEDGNLEVGTWYNSRYGGSDSQFGFETVLLQTQPACGW